MEKPASSNWHVIRQVDLEAKTGVCTVCGPTKVRVRPGGRSPECGTKAKARKKNPVVQRRAHAKRRGHAPLELGEEELAEALKAQAGRCLICRRETKLVPDHCHDTGTFRGWLCNQCNLGLGLFGDDLEKLREAVRYLEGFMV